MSVPPFRVLPSTMASPAQALMARRYSRLVDATAAMGTGIVIDRHADLVAFHESIDQRLVERYVERVREAQAAVAPQPERNAPGEYERVATALGAEPTPDQPEVVAERSYSGYNHWRDDLSRVILDAPADDVWHDRETYVDRPFYPLVNFSDAEGSIGPAAVARLARDFVEHREAYAAHRLTNEHDLDRYDEMAAVFTHAAPAGVVMLS